MVRNAVHRPFLHFSKIHVFIFIYLKGKETHGDIKRPSTPQVPAGARLNGVEARNQRQLPGFHVSGRDPRT